MKTSENKQAIYDFLSNLNIDNLYITDYIRISDIDEYTTFDSLTEILEDKDAFNVEIIYYSNAIKYLMENDLSLQDSIEIATNLGYSTSQINSELLASLLASEKCREEWYDLRDEIEEFLNSIDWDE